MTTPEAEPEITTKRIYVGNLASAVTTEDLIQLFGIGTTPFLRATCRVELATCEKTGKPKNFAIVTVPEEVHSELMGLDGIQFYGQQLAIEEAKTAVHIPILSNEDSELLGSLSMADGGEKGSLPIVINTWPWTKATTDAWKVIESNGSLVDAVVAGCSAAEEDRSITSVGWGGSPAENGETALDAMIMVGDTHDVGGVASMKRIKNAIAVARHVLENTKHSLLVGEDATRFAVQMGFKEEDLQSEQSKSQWENWKNNTCQPNFWKNVEPDPSKSCAPYHPAKSALPTSDGDASVERSDESNHETITTVESFDEGSHDTIGLLAVDASGNIVAGTSTNGATYKITGRVGDSSIVGSGAYVDKDVGAAAATGDGDVMMRFIPSYQAVENMRNGMTPSAAAEAALRRIVAYHKKFEGALVAVTKEGVYGAACYGWNFKYSVINKELGEAKIVEVSPFS